MSPPVDTGLAVGSADPVKVDTEAGEYVNAGGGGDAKSETAVTLVPVVESLSVDPFPVASLSDDGTDVF